MQYALAHQLNGMGLAGLDPDAKAYILAVEAADGQTLESGVRKAINNFVKGCKSDGTWNAIKSSCILAGARTLSGALVPLKGTAPTNFNFVSGDYNRETGLVGNGSTKYLGSNRNGNSDPQDNRHLGFFVSSVHTAGTAGAHGGTGANDTGAYHIGRSSSNPANSFVRNVNATSDTATNQGTTTGFAGMSRSNSADYTFRIGGATTTFTRASQTPRTQQLTIFASDAGNFQSSARLAFYSIGESLNLAQLDSRVSTLVTDLAAAIP